MTTASSSSASRNSGTIQSNCRRTRNAKTGSKAGSRVSADRTNRDQAEIMALVPEAGLEPARPKRSRDFKSPASTISPFGQRSGRGRTIYSRPYLGKGRKKHSQFQTGGTFIADRWDKWGKLSVPKLSQTAFLCNGSKKKKPRNSLNYGAFISGGRGRNRTGVHGFAIRCMTTLPPGLK